ncbi:MAG: ribosomal L7Ae/L30e/S12e/Gadd45 family protein [Anaerotignum sp.]|nr:ribosomal L7Ae/L30e/S12e/Gadd45 family protein [Anaerotignum sp.]
MHKFYSLLGLCKRAGKLAAGEVAAEQAVRKKTAYLLILAEDASANTKKKFRNSAAYYHLPLVETGMKDELGKAIGADLRSILAVTEEGFAKKLRELAEE